MILLHHLEYSRSTRVIWLLEELNIPYEMVRHTRNPITRRAPLSLQNVHPLGKAPMIVDDGRLMAESGAIIEYLINKYGEGQLVPSDPDLQSSYLEWLHFSEGSLAAPILYKLLSVALGGLGDRFGPFNEGEVSKLLGYVERHMTGREYLVGDDLTGADINISYLLEITFAAKMLQNRPALKAFRERLIDRAAYKRAIELGGDVALSF